MKKKIAILSLVLFCSRGAFGQEPQPVEPSSKPFLPRLAVVISVDQMRPDYLDRFRPLFRGAFKRFIEEGIVFADCTLPYAVTETGPGHATLATGRTPRAHGIVANAWYDRAWRREMYCVGDPDAKPVGGGPGGSPKNLKANALGDWLKQKYPSAKVVSIAGKDRAAILMGGQKPDNALWYSKETGGFATSAYYEDELPAWVKSWEKANSAKRYLGKKWDRLFPEASYKECGATDDRFPGEKIPAFGKNTFPYEIPASPQKGFQSVFSTPFVDELCLSLARAAVDAEKLGKDEVPDLLFLGLSAVDIVGHGCGPHSQEAADALLRLDAWLGDFLKHLEKRIGVGNFIVALTADHGVAPLPEWRKLQGKSACRVDKDATKALKEIQEKLAKKFGEGQWLLQIDLQGAYVDFDQCRRKGVDGEEVAREVAVLARQYEFVHGAYLQTELRKPGASDAIVRLLSNSYFADRCPDVSFVAKEWCYVSEYPAGTGHGTPWLYDRALPLLFWGGDLIVGSWKEPVQVIDLAPTVAELLGADAPKDLTGKSLKPLFPK